MAFDLLVFFGILVSFSLWITVCGGKKKKEKKAPGKSTETAIPLVADKKTEETQKASKKSIKSKVDKPKSEMKDEKQEEKSKKSEKKEEEKKESEEKKEDEEEKKDEKESEMKKDVSKVEEKKDEEEEKKEEKKEEMKDEKKEKQDESKKNENASGGKPHISVDPTSTLSFKADQSSQTKLTMKNVHDKKIMFKIKLSDNVSFQVNPVFGVLEPGKTIDIAVTHRKSTQKEGKLVIVNTVLTGDEKKVADLFKQVTKPTGGQVTVKWIAK